MAYLTFSYKHLSQTRLTIRATLYRSHIAAVRHNSTFPYARPGPPPLPSKDQKEWEELIKRRQLPATQPTSHTEEEAKMQLHPDARRPILPDFEGDTNPTTGEIGGPKKEPLNWGAAGEWTYGGRATDF